jgi:hypothetical protein
MALVQMRECDGPTCHINCPKDEIPGDWLKASVKRVAEPTSRNQTKFFHESGCLVELVVVTFPDADQDPEDQAPRGGE